MCEYTKLNQMPICTLTWIVFLVGFLTPRPGVFLHMLGHVLQQKAPDLRHFECSSQIHTNGLAILTARVERRGARADSRGFSGVPNTLKET